MTDQSYTHIVVIRDRSGSMTDIALDMDGGLRTYLAEQAGQPGRATFSLYDFDDTFEAVVEAVALSADLTVRPLVPRGSTALLDAVGKAITAEGERLAGLPEDGRPGHILVQVITDGFENASREWTVAAVKALVTQQEQSYGWTIAFFGTKIDALAEGANLGVSRAFAFPPTSKGVAQTYAVASAATSSLRDGGEYSP